ncbi:MAG: pyridoxal-phosphate dependent enzyme [Acidimicrobiia bacterium]|nr:pyridoxal-phosphate dependent enzyme [Acidimicrobiia bacterium]
MTPTSITSTTVATPPAQAAANLGLTLEMADSATYDRAVERFRDNEIVLPTFAQLTDPSTIPSELTAELAGVDRNGADPRNLFRVHWFNRLDGSGPSAVPDHVVLPAELTGVDATIVLALGNRFPMIGAHKVLAAYACLVPQLLTGRFDPTRHRAIWPSTGNYARGGVAISRIMGCRGVAVLPEGMSRERFEWLDRWIAHPDDVIRTIGTESNVKEIYDACAELATDPTNVILNQFSQFSNHLGHYHVTGRALERVVEAVAESRGGGELAAFVSASGSAGTLGAGDYLKDRHGSRIVAVEALECPTMLYNGYGEHNIQGIGDKHIPLIHNVTNTDLVVGISDRSTDTLDVVFNTDAGKAVLLDKGVSRELVDDLVHLGFSSICNALAAIKAAKHWDLGADDIVVTVATDGSELYPSERAKTLAAHYPDGFEPSHAIDAYAEHLATVTDEHVLDMDDEARNRVFNLGYFTWVEQQGIDVADFEARRSQDFWDGTRHFVTDWDAMIGEFNARTGLG